MHTTFSGITTFLIGRPPTVASRRRPTFFSRPPAGEVEQLLVELDRAVWQMLDFDAEKILHGTFVGNIPALGHFVHEIIVGAAVGTAAGVVEGRRVYDLKVVHIDADRQDFAVGAVEREYAAVGIRRAA